MKSNFSILIVIAIFITIGCGKDEFDNLIKTESLENLYGCPDTRYGLECSLDNDYRIIRSQQSFLDFTTGTCRPEIDFQSYDLVVGKKRLTTGNSSIEYELRDDIQEGIKVLKVTFHQNIALEAPNLTYHALIPKLGDEETVRVDIEVKI
jgi:hypothetical protein